MCDTVCSLGPDGTLLAKNSDRPEAETQLVAAHAARPAGGAVATQYLSLPETGSAATLLARPTWLWGAEHGVSAHRVAAGNERVYTTGDPAAAEALIGMDLVRLVLERATSAEHGVEVLAGLLERHGQGGVGDLAHGEAYDSSFLLADPGAAWVVETAGRRWAAAPADGPFCAISNRLSLGRTWVRGSADLAPGDDFDRFRDPSAPTRHADLRLAASHAFGADPPGGAVTPRTVVGHLRDHGTGPWGEVGSTAAVAPSAVAPDFSGISVCMHIPGYLATTSSMVAWLPRHPDDPLRAWVAAGSPCVSAFVPAFPPQPARPAGAVPAVLADPAAWAAGASLRDAVVADPRRLEGVRAVLAPLEASLWDEADEVAATPAAWPAAVRRWDARVRAALRRLGDGAG